MPTMLRKQSLCWYADWSKTPAFVACPQAGLNSTAFRLAEVCFEFGSVLGITVSCITAEVLGSRWAFPLHGWAMRVPSRWSLRSGRASKISAALLHLSDKRSQRCKQALASPSHKIIE